MELATIVLALALGFVIGLVVGARRALNLVLSGRAVRGTTAGIARFMPDTMPTRNQEDQIAGRIRILLGGTVYALPVLPRPASRRWLETVDARFAQLALTVDAAGANVPEIIATMLTETDALYDVLLSYDQSTPPVLPPRAEIDEVVTDVEILHGVLEVWRAVHPLAATVIAGMSPTNTASPGPTSSPPQSTAGPLPSSIG